MMLHPSTLGDQIHVLTQLKELIRDLIRGKLQPADVEPQLDVFLPRLIQHRWFDHYFKTHVFPNLVAAARDRFLHACKPNGRKRVNSSQDEQLQIVEENLRRILTNPAYFLHEFHKAILAECKRLAPLRCPSLKGSDLDDVAGDAVSTFCGKIDRCPLLPGATADELSAYLGKFAKNKGRNLERARRHQNSHIESVPDIAAVKDKKTYDDSETQMQMVHQLIAHTPSLTPIELEILNRLAACDGTSLVEIARELGMRKGTAYSHKCRAMAKLQKTLALYPNL